MFNNDYTNHPAFYGRCSYPYNPTSSHVKVFVSILTPFYNTATVFLETAASIFRQSFQEWEWIVVDDGSTDQVALDQLEHIQKSDPRIKVIHQVNSGPSAARNTAFNNSKGKYVCLLDSDDLIEPTFLEKAIWFLESQPDFAFCNSWIVVFGQEEELITSGFNRGKEYVRANSGPPHSVIRSNAYAAVNGFDETIRMGHEDWDFWLAMASAGFWGHTLPEYLEWYRMSETGRYSQLAKSPVVHKQFERYIKKKYNKLEANFPNPKLREMKPYEGVGCHIPFDNQIAPRTGNNRILFLIPWMVTGGADKVHLDWISGLVDRGYQVSICATLKAKHEWLPEFSAITPDIFILPNFLHPVDFPRFIVYLIRSRAINTVVISNCTLGYQLLPYLRSSCPDISFVDLSHVEEPHWLNGGHPRFGVGYQDMLDLNIVTTKKLLHRMGEMGGDLSRVKVCYTGVSHHHLAKYHELRNTYREKLGIEQELPLLVYAARICEQKRPELLASVLSEIANEDIPFHCLIIGDGDLMPLLKRRIRQYGLRHSVTLLGTLSHQKWLEALAASDIFFLPSLYEGISVALYEAMAMKVVPVMSEVGGQSEVVTNKCGMLIPQDEQEIENYVSALKLLILQPLMRQQMADEGCRQIASRFTLEDSCNRLVEILDTAIEYSHQKPRRPVSVNLAKELATLAIEYFRLTVSEPIPSSVSRLLSWIRTYKIGRALLRIRWVYSFGQYLLNVIRNHR